MDDDAAAELELVQAMYTADELKLAMDSGGATLTVRLTPSAATHRYAEAHVGLRLGAGYPQQAAEVSLDGTRGLVEDEEARLIRSVRSRALELAGECAVVLLLEEALEVLTEINRAGDCPICREPLLAARAPPTFLAPCYHSFHTPCLGRWRAVVAATRRADADAAEGGEAVPGPAAAAAKVARAAVAESEALCARVAAASAAARATEERIEALRAAEEPPPPSAFRLGEEQLSRDLAELASLESRHSRALSRARVAESEADAAAREAAEAVCAVPLPCPVCRAPIAIDRLHECVPRERARENEPSPRPLPTWPHTSAAGLY